MLFINKLLDNPGQFFTTVAIVIFSVMLHELAHGYMAMAQGDDTPRISGHLTLNPVRLMSWQSLIFLCVAGLAWGQMPVNPTKFRLGKLSSILVFVAGPLANLALGFLLIEAYKLSTTVALLRFAQPELLLMAAQINLILFLLNLLPIPPLDGFQVICEIIPPLQALQRTRWALFVLMVLLLVPAFGTSLQTVAQSIITGVMA
ncbi:MAG: site-2 protease family protein [Elainella sp.]